MNGGHIGMKRSLAAQRAESGVACCLTITGSLQAFRHERRLNVRENGGNKWMKRFPAAQRESLAWDVVKELLASDRLTERARRD